VNLWTRYSFSDDQTKGLWIGGGFNNTGVKAEISKQTLPLPAEPDGLRCVVVTTEGRTATGRPRILWNRT